MTEKTAQPVRVSAQAWRCPCGLLMGIPERPVCTCGEWSLDGPVRPQAQPGKEEPAPASVEASGGVTAPGTAKR